MSVELAFIIGVVVLLLLAIKFRVSAFISLLVTGVVIGTLSGMSGLDVIDTITNGFAKTVGSIGIIIIFGVMLGKYLEDSKAANKMALGAVGMVGEKNSSIAMAISGYLVSIPVFSDVAYVMMAPLIKAISKKTRIPLAVLGVSLASGLLATHVYVPPTPGPLAAAGLLGIDIGRAILYGGFAAILMTLFGWAFAQFVLNKKGDTFISEFDKGAKGEMLASAEEEVSEKDLPSMFSSLFPLLLPMILILLNTTTKAIFPEESTIVRIMSFIGDSNIALAIGVVACILLLGKRIGKENVLKTMDGALSEAGSIIFITASGGALGEILKASGAGDAMAQAISKSGLPFILIPFAIAALLKIVQGSGTVAVVTAATLSAPLATQLGMDPILIFLATGAGARSFCHVNDSFFWVFTKMNGYDMKTGLRTLSFANPFMALGGLVATFIVSLFV
ncbi:GntP family permease [Irregularibacter muris]|uniref:GntP family permease n=1 Tax=Irregularibacter muris TaxID=1796619 RepID=A0AAE3HF98_9FIRM|nr:GntP family permease [Irregularibacter muris]MCR1899051.1 GntP family permease [Irregularibacter muris]